MMIDLIFIGCLIVRTNARRSPPSPCLLVGSNAQRVKVVRVHALVVEELHRQLRRVGLGLHLCVIRNGPGCVCRCKEGVIGLVETLISDLSCKHGQYLSLMLDQNIMKMK